MFPWLPFARRHVRTLSAVVVGVIVLILAGLYLQNDLNRGALDPKVPFQIYRPPAAPDYANAAAWYLNPALSGYTAVPQKVDVFFVHGTTYNGGKAWLGSLDERAAGQEVENVHLPNYAAPFAIYGNVYAPKYRQANLFTQLTSRDDAREALEYAYRDVESAFAAFMKTRKGGRGFVVVGLEQGGLHVQRLLKTVIQPDAQMAGQLVGAYLIENLVADNGPEEMGPGFPKCERRDQFGCVVAYVAVESPDTDKALRVLRRSLYWTDDGRLTSINGKPVMCVNPVTGSATQNVSDKGQALGATNATGLEWEMQPPLIAHSVGARCVAGLLVVNMPSMPSFQVPLTWTEKRKVSPYNLFYGDLKADLNARLIAFRGAAPAQ